MNYVVLSFPRIKTILLISIVALTFAPAMARAANCTSSADSRQLDFWLGEWTVSYPNAPAVSSSKVYLDLDKCLLVENWVGGRNHRGLNMFAYSADDKMWHGMFADNEGRVHIFEGTVTSASAEFRGPSLGPDGKKFVNRIRVVRMNPDKIEQTWEKSSDNGATWNMEFQGEYSRKP